mmetsp:Transcript_21769/g.48691  ORF Transcript_21769/g.48691 Transcript_21769/m.48691 type:complete len:209 (+) Transcript_21769:1871-2497(+)
MTRNPRPVRRTRSSSIDHRSFCWPPDHSWRLGIGPCPSYEGHLLQRNAEYNRDGHGVDGGRWRYPELQSRRHRHHHQSVGRTKMQQHQPRSQTVPERARWVLPPQPRHRYHQRSFYGHHADRRCLPSWLPAWLLQLPQKRMMGLPCRHHRRHIRHQDRPNQIKDKLHHRRRRRHFRRLTCYHRHHEDWHGRVCAASWRPGRLPSSCYY